MGVALALLASALWGVSDFIGGVKTKTMPVLGVLLAAQPAGLLVLVPIVAIRGHGPPDGLHALWAVLSGSGGLLGLAALYRGLATGAMGVVAPITATAPAVAVVVGVARGDRPSILQGIGIACALCGVFLAARERAPAADSARVATGVGFALVAALAFGATFIGIDAASNADPYWATLILRLTSLTLVVSAVAATRPALGGVLPSLLLLAGAGALDAGATALFALATTRGLISVVSVLVSLYPVVIVLLARVILDERLQRIQQIGAATALAGAALISI
jgi:drug/metabolite transporter (DMT)-like permease